MTRKNVPFARSHVKTQCSTCKGSGTVRDGKDDKSCPNCAGQGEV